MAFADIMQFGCSHGAVKVFNEKTRRLEFLDGCSECLSLFEDEHEAGYVNYDLLDRLFNNKSVDVAESSDTCDTLRALDGEQAQRLPKTLRDLGWVDGEQA